MFFFLMVVPVLPSSDGDYAIKTTGLSAVGVNRLVHSTQITVIDKSRRFINTRSAFKRDQLKRPNV